MPKRIRVKSKAMQRKLCKNKILCKIKVIKIISYN